MSRRRDYHAGIGWLALAALVGAWDLLNQRSLSSFAHAHRTATLVVGGVTLAHLLDVLPDGLDPFDALARRVGDRLYPLVHVSGLLELEHA